MIICTCIKQLLTYTKSDDDDADSKTKTKKLLTIAIIFSCSNVLTLSALLYDYGLYSNIGSFKAFNLQLNCFILFVVDRWLLDRITLSSGSHHFREVTSK